MKVVDMATGAVFFLLGSFALFISVGMPMVSDGVPGAGLFPLILSIGIIVCGVILFITKAVSKRDLGPSPMPSSGEWIRVGIMMGAFVISIFLVSLIGFMLAMVVLSAALLLGVLGRRDIWGVIISIVVPVLVWLLFAYVLGVPLPLGVFGA